jgi:hypothetical protein
MERLAITGLLDCTVPHVAYFIGVGVQWHALGAVTSVVGIGYLVDVNVLPQGKLFYS